MGRRYINQLGEREEINEVYLASDKQLRPNRAGNLYLQMRLSDRTGSCNAMMWNANDGDYQAFDNGDFVQVRGTSQFYNGNLQIIVNHLDQAEPGDVNEAEFVQVSEQQRAELAGRLSQILRSINDFQLKTLAECFLIDDEFLRQFSNAPAGVKNHHAYCGGLIEHVVNLMEVVQVVAPKYPQLNPDLLLMGAFLHDVGKIVELTYDKGLGYSDEGQLVGHLVQGVSILERKIAEAEDLSGEPFCPSLAAQLKHIIVSHHGKLEFGSPKLPMTLEAVALHYLDDLDAKIHGFHQLMSDDVNVDSSWTTFHPQLGRKLFKSDS